MFYDFIFSKMIKSFKKLKWFKFFLNREIILYLIFGVLTTLVNIFVYLLFVEWVHINYIHGNIIAWFLSVVFAYITNRIFVFKSKNKKIFSEFTFFVGSRLFSGCLDTLLLYIFVSLCYFDDLISKVVIGVIVVIVNYILSKMIIFRN